MEKREDTSWNGERKEEEGKLHKKEGMKGKDSISTLHKTLIYI